MKLQQGHDRTSTNLLSKLHRAILVDFLVLSGLMSFLTLLTRRIAGGMAIKVIFEGAGHLSLEIALGPFQMDCGLT